MRPINPLLLIDFYKAGHRAQYPEDTTLVYSNFTPRVSRVPGVESMVFYGLQYAVQEYLIDRFGRDFFARPKAEVVDEYRDFMDCTLGPGAVACDHIEALWDLGYLPVEIRALPEGTHVPMGVPALTIHNTQPDFFWLPNYLETLLSCLLWKPCTTATTAGQFFQNFIRYAEATGGDLGFVPFQGHDFSFRGMSLPEDGIVSGSAHLLWFTGTDTVPAIRFHELYYGADRHRELVGCSVSATEHSVMSAGGNDQEFETYKRLLTEVYPHGIVSIVSDTWDFWAVVTDFLPRLKGEILARGENAPTAMNKLVIRPDSGVPHKIINGDPTADTPWERLGLVRCLDEVFGHTVNAQGYRVLHPAVGFIYGDAITVDEQVRILEGLKANGYATTCGVLGVGSFSYQMVTRDTYGTVCKATYCEIDGEGRELFKNPKTGGWKKSHRGLLRVNDDLSVSQGVSWAEAQTGLLEPVFRDGVLLRTHTLAEIRARVRDGVSAPR